MRVAICAAQVPFEHGGAEIHVEGLRAALTRAGHEVEVISLPFKWYPATELLKSALAWRLIDITESNGVPIDLAICTKFPTWAVRHPNKIAWVIHQYRQAYDWFGTEFSDLTGTPEDLALRRRIQHIDARGLGECRARFTNSANTAKRLAHYNGMTADPLHVPISLEGLYPVAYEPFIFTVSRLDPTKRVDLLLSAVAASTTRPKVVVAGQGQERRRLEQLAHDLGIAELVTFAGRVSDQELVDYYNRCRAVFYGPKDEDFGLATVEAFTAGKPVVTVGDSGGVLELVQDGENGMIAPDPNAESVAPLIDRLIEDPAMAESMGRVGFDRARDITWERVVEKLVGGSSV